MVDVVSTDDLILLHFSQNARYDIVVEFTTYSLHVHLLEWIEILEYYLESGAFFKAMGVDDSYVIFLG